MLKRFSPAAVAQKISQFFNSLSIYTQLIVGTLLMLALFLITAILVAISLIENDRQTSQIMMVVATTISALLGVCIAVVLARRIARPIVQIMRAAQQMDPDHLDSSAQLTDMTQLSGSKEVAALAYSVNAMAERFHQTLNTLEQKGAVRTQDLERRSAQLRLAAEVARDASSIRELDVLLNRSANLVRERFNYYHVGIFLVGHDGGYAVLKAGTGDTGQKMLDRGHQFKVGEASMVGYVAASGLPRISQDTEQEAAHFRNPLLPETRSEVALPLKIGNQVIGVLDVHSQQVSAFNQDDVDVLRIMADQLAVAIDNARLFEEAQESLKQVQVFYENLSQEAWDKLVQATPIIGYQYDAMGPRAIQASLGKASQPTPTLPAPSVSVPIKVRNQVIATLDVWPRRGEISEDNRALLTDLSDRVSQALESARLFNDTRARATREQILNQLISRLSQVPDLDILLQTTVREIGHIHGVAEAAIHITVPEMLASTEVLTDDKAAQPEVQR